MKCHGNGGTGPQGCYGGQCHTGSISSPAPEDPAPGGVTHDR